jgi:acyl-CoA thioesterase-1
MAPVWTNPESCSSEGRTSRLRTSLAVICLLLELAFLQVAHAGVSANCKVPDAILNLPAPLIKTAETAAAGQIVRIAVIGPGLSGPAFSERRRAKLQRELEARLPTIQVEILDEGRGAALIGDDFDRLRESISRTAPDLVVWQIGTPDAVSGIDPEKFSETLSRATEWLKGQNVDFILMDPPFVPSVDHEKLYLEIVNRIGASADQTGINLFRRYAATQFLDNARQKSRAPDDPSVRRACTPELLAEAISRAMRR